MDKFRSSLTKLLDEYNYNHNRLYLENSVRLSKRKLSHDQDIHLRTVQKIAEGFDRIPLLFCGVINKEFEDYGFGEDLGQYIGRNFVRARSSMNYSGRVVSEKTGVSISHYNKYEYGLALPTVSRLERVSLVLGLVPKYFVEKCQKENV